MEFRTNVVRLSGGRLANKISKKIAVLLMKMPSLLMAEKIVPKILLMDKAVVILLIRSFFDNGGLLANYTYTISYCIIAVHGLSSKNCTEII